MLYIYPLTTNYLRRKLTFQNSWKSFLKNTQNTTINKKIESSVFASLSFTITANFADFLFEILQFYKNGPCKLKIKSLNTIFINKECIV